MEEFHYEEVQLSEMELVDGILHFPCPCGDLFELPLVDFIAGSDVAQCPTCSLTVKVLFTAEEKREYLTRTRSTGPCTVSA